MYDFNNIGNIGPFVKILCHDFNTLLIANIGPFAIVTLIAIIYWFVC